MFKMDINNLRRLNFKELKVGMLVVDTDSNLGRIIKIVDIHNIHVKHGSSLIQLECLSERCEMYDPLFEPPFIYRLLSPFLFNDLNFSLRWKL